MSKRKEVTAAEFDAKFDAGEDVSEHLEEEAAVWRLTVEFPEWMIKEMDDEAKRLSTTRKAVLKRLVDDGLRELRKTRAADEALRKSIEEAAQKSRSSNVAAS